MGDPIYIDTQGIENSVYNAIVGSMPDLDPLVRACKIFELQTVERRLEAGQAVRVEAMSERRDILLEELWPADG